MSSAYVHTQWTSGCSWGRSGGWMSSLIMLLLLQASRRFHRAYLHLNWILCSTELSVHFSFSMRTQYLTSFFPLVVKYNDPLSIHRGVASRPWLKCQSSRMLKFFVENAVVFAGSLCHPYPLCVCVCVLDHLLVRHNTSDNGTII